MEASIDDLKPSDYTTYSVLFSSTSRGSFKRLVARADIVVKKIDFIVERRQLSESLKNVGTYDDLQDAINAYNEI